jgi:hypothetical protein
VHPAPAQTCRLILAVAAILISAPARATPGPAEREAARAKLVEGVSLLDRGAFADALTRFEEAYRTVPSSKILYNIGLALKGMGRYAQAFTVFEQFSREVSDAAPEHVDYSKRELERLARQVAFVQVSSDVAEAEVLLDGQSLGKFPIPKRLAVDGGSHELMLRVPLGTITRQFTAQPGQILEMKIEVAAAVGPGPSAGPAPSAAAADLRSADRPGPAGAGGFALALEAGVRLPRFHAVSPDRAIEPPVLGLATLRAGHRWALGAVDLDLGLCTSFARLPYVAVPTGDTTASSLLGLSLSAGLSRPLGTLRLGADLDAGVLWWAGLQDGDPFTIEHAGATGPVPMPTLGLGLSLEYPVFRSLFLAARLSYAVSLTTSSGLTESISRVSAFDGQLGAGVRF